MGLVPCSEPISTLPVAQYTDQLILAQGLRVLDYMDRGQSGHLPWTSLTVYDWMRSRSRGFNISDTAGFSSCCQQIGGAHAGRHAVGPGSGGVGPPEAIIGGEGDRADMSGPDQREDRLQP